MLPSLSARGGILNPYEINAILNDTTYTVYTSVPALLKVSSLENQFSPTVPCSHSEVTYTLRKP